MMNNDKKKVVIAGGKYVLLSLVTVATYKVARLIAKTGYARGVEDARENYISFNEE